MFIYDSYHILIDEFINLKMDLYDDYLCKPEIGGEFGHVKSNWEDKRWLLIKLTCIIVFLLCDNCTGLG